MERKKQSVSRGIFGAALIILLLPVLLPLLAFILVLFVLSRCLLYLLIWTVWLPRGKDTLFVYSDSPIWREYMIGQVLPLVEQRAIVLNWSERRNWRQWSLAVWVFRSFGRSYEFNPLVVLFRPFRLARTFRFWSAFKDWKHGNAGPVEALRDDLRMVL